MPSVLDLGLVFLGTGVVLLLAGTIAGNVLAAGTGAVLIVQACVAIWRVEPGT